MQTKGQKRHKVRKKRQCRVQAVSIIKDQRTKARVFTICELKQHKAKEKKPCHRATTVQRMMSIHQLLLFRLYQKKGKMQWKITKKI